MNVSPTSNENIKSVNGNNLPHINETNTRKNQEKEKMSFSIFELIHKCRNSRKLVLLVVFIALFFDNMLLTTVVPIIPDYLFALEHPNETVEVQTLLRMRNLTYISDDEYKSRFAIEENISDLERQVQRERNIERLKIEEKAKIVAENWKKVQMNKLNTKVGLMFASKPVVQLMVNPFIGPLTHKIGYSIPMFTGFIIMFLSTITFAFSQSYTLLFVARAVQGIGSACSSVAGLGMLADTYPDDEERGKAMGIALGGLAMGVLVGPPFGGIVYEFLGKEAPFIILASLGILDGVLQLLILQPSVQKETVEGAPLRKLISDPYILIAAGAISFGNMGIAMMEPSLPIWMINTMHSENWQLGAAFLPASISYLVGTNLFGRIAFKYGRWLCSMIGLIVIGIALMMVPLATSIYGLIIPNGMLGFAIGMVDATMMPEMGHLVDIRHSSVYGSVYAIADVAFCLGFAIGPALSGVIVSHFGFRFMLFVVAIIGIAYAPLMLFLKNPPAKEENMSLIMNERSQTIKYVSYNDRNKSSEVISDSDDF